MNSPRHLIALLALVATGCGTGPDRAADVDPERARAALTATLDAWKRGEPITAVRPASSVTVQDFDWAGGFRLIDYELLEPGTAEDANLLVPVRLKLKAPDGKPTDRRVRYVIGTSPSVTVFREMF